MLSKKNRLKKKEEIEKIFTEGLLVYNKFLKARIIFNKLPYSRFAFSIGLGFSKKAVKRNKLKRIIRSLIRENIERIKSELDIVFYLKKEEKIELKIKSIRPIFEEFLEKNNLLKK